MGSGEFDGAKCLTQATNYAVGPARSSFGFVNPATAVTDTAGMNVEDSDIHPLAKKHARNILNQMKRAGIIASAKNDTELEKRRGNS